MNSVNGLNSKIINKETELHSIRTCHKNIFIYILIADVGRKIKSARSLAEQERKEERNFTLKHYYRI